MASNPVNETPKPPMRRGDIPASARVARLAWFELADAATRRALAQEIVTQRTAGMPH